MYVVYNKDTGWSDESMRFATREDAQDWISNVEDLDAYAIRYEP
jgi:hypothetical protein